MRFVVRRERKKFPLSPSVTKGGFFMSNCLVCRRTLKREPSLSRGIGPKCAVKVRGMAGMTGSGGKSFSVLGNEFWEKFIDEHVAIKNRQETVQQVVEQIPESEKPKNEGARLTLEQVGTYRVYGKKIDDDGDLATMFRDMSSFDREKLYVACTDAEGNIVGTQCVSVGNINSSIASTREILKVPFLLGADNFYLLHNHPSGDPEPSDEDKAVTKRVKTAAELIGIQFSGHAVIGENGYSFIKADDYASTTAGSYKDAEESTAPLFDTKQQNIEKVKKEKMTSPNDVGAYARREVFRNDQKGVFLMCTNTKNEVVSVSPFSYEDFTQNTKALVLGNATSAFLVSDKGVNVREFKETATQFRRQASVLGVDLLDAVVVVDDHVQSIRSEEDWR